MLQVLAALERFPWNPGWVFGTALRLEAEQPAHGACHCRNPPTECSEAMDAFVRSLLSALARNT